MPQLYYQLQHDVSSSPYFKGTASEVVEHLQDDVEHSRLNRGDRWQAVISEVPQGGAKRMPAQPWMGAVVGENGKEDGGTVIKSAFVRHLSHAGEWGYLVGAGAKHQAMLDSAMIPEFTPEILRMPESERRKAWLARKEKGDKLIEQYVVAMEQRDDLADERVDGISFAFQNAGIPTSEQYAAPDRYDQYALYSRSPEWYEERLAATLAGKNLDMIFDDYHDRPEKRIFKGYFKRPDGSYHLGRISRAHVDRMVEAEDFTPTKRGKRSPAKRQEFKTRKGA